MLKKGHQRPSRQGAEVNVEGVPNPADGHASDPMEGMDFSLHDLVAEEHEEGDSGSDSASRSGDGPRPSALDMVKARAVAARVRKGRIQRKRVPTMSPLGGAWQRIVRDEVPDRGNGGNN